MYGGESYGVFPFKLLAQSTGGRRGLGGFRNTGTRGQGKGASLE